MPLAGQRLCLHGGHVWTGMGGDLVEGGLMLSGDRIEAVLAPAEYAAARTAADAELDTTGLVAMPPFYSGHVHSSASLFRGTENSLPLELWSYYAISYGRGFDARTVRAAALLTAAEMIRNGVGGYTDHFPQARLGAAAIRAHAESGLNVGFAPFFADLLDEDILKIPFDRDVMQRLMPMASRTPGEIEAGILDLHGEVARNGGGRVRLLLGPNAPQRCSDALLDAWCRLKDETGAGSHTHLLETLPQRRASDRRWPGGVVAALRHRGLLDPGLSVAHGIWLDDRDRAHLAEHGVTLVHNPSSNLMLGSGRMDVRAALRAGVPVGLGTDSSNTGGRHDLFEAMRHMLVAGREPGSDPADWIRPTEALTAATRGAAAVFPGAGRLQAGAVADVLLFDRRGGPVVAASACANTLVVHGDARCVHSLMVGGRWVLRDNRIEAFDEAAVLAEAATCASALRHAAKGAEADLAGLHEPYRAWSGAVFEGACCPSCDMTRRQCS